MENVLENSACPLPAGVHLNEDAAGAGGRDVAVFSKGDLCQISAHVLSMCPAVVLPVVDKLPLKVPMWCCLSVRICEIAH